MGAAPCSTEMYSLISSADMEMAAAAAAAAAFPCKNNNHLQWSGGLFFSSKMTVDSPESTDYAGPGLQDPSTHHDMTGATTEAAMADWMNNIHHHQHDHDPSLSIVFPCHGNQGPSSLSQRSSDQPSITAGPPVTLDQLGQHRHHDPGYFGQSWIRASQYLGPAQDLLKEICDIRKKESDDDATPELELRKGTSHRLDESGATLSQPSLDSLDLLGLHMRKTKLIQMIHEVDRRYKHYNNQMRGVVSSFEFVAGDGAAAVYSAMASKVMSKHFRCLRDGIAAQIKATRKSIEEKNANNAAAVAAASATNKGETPRLRLLDQAFRQQKTLQHMNMMGSHPWRAQRGLPERSVSLLRAWLFEHFFHPYPSDVDKHILAHQTGLSRSQVSNWFINARVRLWKPMVEEMYSAELKDGLDEIEPHQSHLSRPNDCDRKPPGLADPTAISRTSRDAAGRRCLQKPKFMEIDFSAYEDRSSASDGGGVSLSLGLQALPPATAYEMVSYSVLDECEGGGQNLVYRDLVEAQLLHDLAG